MNKFKLAKRHVTRVSTIVRKSPRQPWTYVEVEVTIAVRGAVQTYLDFGFAKVTHPDEWDKEYGIVLARRKAEAEIARRMLADGWDVPVERLDGGEGDVAPTA